VTQTRLATYSPELLPALVAFLNKALSGHRHWVPISERDFTERVLRPSAFDPRGLILDTLGEVPRSYGNPMAMPRQDLVEEGNQGRQ